MPHHTPRSRYISSVDDLPSATVKALSVAPGLQSALLLFLLCVNLWVHLAVACFATSAIASADTSSARWVTALLLWSPAKISVTSPPLLPSPSFLPLLLHLLAGSSSSPSSLPLHPSINALPPPSLFLCPSTTSPLINGLPPPSPFLCPSTHLH